MTTVTLAPCHVKKFGDTKSWSIYPEGAGKSVASVKDEAYANVMGAAVDLLVALEDTNELLVAQYAQVSNPDDPAGWSDDDAYAVYRRNADLIVKARTQSN